MRHSSWTLFLVPLIIPLILLGFSWASENLGQNASWGEVRQEFSQEVPSVNGKGVTGAVGIGRETDLEPSEALFR